jgi:hypothetical protein
MSVEFSREELADIEPFIATYELAERNAEALRLWHLRCATAPALEAMGAPYPDAHAPLGRDYLTRWFDHERSLATRWIFKNRCEKALVGIVIRSWARARQPMLLRKQAE